MFTKRIRETDAEFDARRGPCAKEAFGAGIESQVLPPFSVRAMVRQGVPVQSEIPRTKPILGETKVADSGSKPAGRGVPTGAVIGGFVVVVVILVVEVDEVVVVVGDALFVDELRP